MFNVMPGKRPSSKPRGFKQLNSSIATGGGGTTFEHHVQASFVALLLSGGHAPCLPNWPIRQIKLQGRVDGWETDDLIVFVQSPNGAEQRRLVGQVKRTISFTKSDPDLREVIQAAWNDFNNPKVFDQNKDVLALITGPLTRTDTKVVQWLLEQARTASDSAAFFGRVPIAQFAPPGAEEKLGVIREQLKRAHHDEPVPDADTFEFLRRYYLLGYDLGYEEGVVLSLLHSHIGQFAPIDARAVFDRIVGYTSRANPSAGTISLENIPEDIRDHFQKKQATPIPAAYTQPTEEHVQADWSQVKDPTFLALATLVGRWDEARAADQDAIAHISREPFAVWRQKAQSLIQWPSSPLTLLNGVWQVRDRIPLLQDLGRHLFDQHVADVAQEAVRVLTEVPAAPHLTGAERPLAGLFGKVTAHSNDLRRGLAEGLALLKNQQSALVRCSSGRTEAQAVKAVREILAPADAELWTTLDRTLPILAQAAPDVFLQIVERDMREGSGLFAPPNGPATGTDKAPRHHIPSGLLWACEALAWNEPYLASASLVLALLQHRFFASAGGNQPDRSLAQIFMPWHPQTFAPPKKRYAVIDAICQELPDVGWKLVLDLLPHVGQYAVPTYQPQWMHPDRADFEVGVSPDEFRDQIDRLGSRAITLAGQDPARLAQLIEQTAALPNNAIQSLYDGLHGMADKQMSDQDRRVLWGSLTRHRQAFAVTLARAHSQAAASETDVTALIERLRPLDLVLRYQPLFGRDAVWRMDHSLDIQSRGRALLEQRLEAVQKLLEAGGVSDVLRLAEIAEAQADVGRALAAVGTGPIDREVLARTLQSQDTWAAALRWGYFRGRVDQAGWTWIDQLYAEHEMEPGSLMHFMTSLPFSEETWARAERWLGDRAADYWREVAVDPYGAEGDVTVAIDRLIEVGRLEAAVDVLCARFERDGVLERDRAIVALSQRELVERASALFDSYEVRSLIDALRQDPSVSQDTLVQIEWLQLPLLFRQHDYVPKALEGQLASDPSYFHKVITWAYRSRHVDKRDASAGDAHIAQRAIHLLTEWRTPPGTTLDGGLDGAGFKAWLGQARALCASTGHLEAGLTHIGQVLVHSPQDPDSLWIHRAIAEALNAPDADELRRGYRIGETYTGEFHWVDPTGEAERQRAAAYRDKADAIENAGYPRFAQALRTMAADHDREAQRNIDGHARDQDG